MGINVLKLVPSKPEFVPDAKAVEAAKTFLSSTFPKAQAISFRLWGSLQFVDNAGFFESVYCPQCKSEIDSDWWTTSMNFKWNDDLKGFENLDIETPCCKFKTSLNDLEYHSQACFAVRAIEVQDAPRQLTRRSSSRLNKDWAALWWKSGRDINSLRSLSAGIQRIYRDLGIPVPERVLSSFA